MIQNLTEPEKEKLKILNLFLNLISKEKQSNTSPFNDTERALFTRYVEHLLNKIVDEI